MLRHIRLIMLVALCVVLPAAATAAAPFAYITNSGSGTISVIDVATNAQSDLITLPNGAVPYGVALSPDGKTLYATNFGNAALFKVDLATKTTTVISTNTASGAYGVAIHPSGSHVYVTHNTWAGGMSIFDTATFTRTPVASGRLSAGVAVNAARGHLYVAHMSGISVFDLTSHAPIHTISMPHAWGLAVHPDGGTLYATMPTTTPTGSLAVINTGTFGVTRLSLEGSRMPVAVAVSPDGRWVYVTNHLSNTVSVIDASTNTFVTNVPVGTLPFGLQFTPDGSQAYVANWGSSTVSVINTATRAVTTAGGHTGAAPVAFGLFISAAPNAITVMIDVMPGGDPAVINLKARGVLPVAILGSATFNVADVDARTVTFAGAPVRMKGNGEPMASFEDVNDDGYLDLVVHVDRTALTLQPGDREGVLEGQTHDGRRFRGKDKVKVLH